MTRFPILAGTLAFVHLLTAQSAVAVNGEILITQARALAGKVSPGDDPGFPVTLSQAGVYKLAGVLSAGPDQTGIEVNAPDITIDFNGFLLGGGSVGGTNNATRGILVRGDRVTIRNGTVAAFELEGIRADERAYLTIENMRIVNNGNWGVMNADGQFSRFLNNVTSRNIGGIVCGRYCHIEGGIISGNVDHGVIIQSGTVLGNTIISNGRYGIWEFSTVVNDIVGSGNNTVAGNNLSFGGAQLNGSVRRLFPNLCAPTAC